MAQFKGNNNLFHETSIIVNANGEPISSFGTGEYYLNVARGLVPGFLHVHKFGANFEIDTGTDPETVWTEGGLYPWSAFDSAQTIYLQSTDNSDTEILEIQGLDEDYELVSETVTLNGTTSVSTTNTFKRVFRMIYNHNAVNAGKITARTVSGSGTVVASIEAGYAQTLMALYTIPKGYTGYLLCWNASVQKNKDAQVRLFQAPLNQSFKIAHMAEVFESTYRYDFPVPLKYNEKTDIELRAAEVENNNTRVSANFDVLLVAN